MQLDPAVHSAEQVVQQLALSPHPEGGWYREVHRSPLQVQRADGCCRSALTQILFLLARGDCSRWHRVLAAEELWQLLAGDPLDLWLLPPQGGASRQEHLQAHSGAAPVVVPADWWQAARSCGRWSLMRCSVAPGFSFDDFQLLHQLSEDQRPTGALSEFL